MPEISIEKLKEELKKRLAKEGNKEEDKEIIKLLESMGDDDPPDTLTPQPDEEQPTASQGKNDTSIIFYIFIKLSG